MLTIKTIKKIREGKKQPKEKYSKSESGTFLAIQALAPKGRGNSTAHQTC